MDKERPVMTFFNRRTDTNTFMKIENKKGRFLGWGLNYNNYNNCVVTMAIIEFNDGTVEYFGLKNIQFLDR